ncbi:hypothetical protein [Chitinophaga caseinilytica]|uniref:Uncharacterized protein n=1 Tax=Chitinophaga caseinilytica TaxID=2267521 RepID=A0ABZ2Z2H7_9BACT
MVHENKVIGTSENNNGMLSQMKAELGNLHRVIDNRLELNEIRVKNASERTSRIEQSVQLTNNRLFGIEMNDFRHESQHQEIKSRLFQIEQHVAQILRLLNRQDGSQKPVSTN